MAPATTAPPALPPSVEEAYRRKCIQLKQRTKEVEAANDAANLRLARLKRQIEKMRLERAFLLEQLAKRTSTNVEDSDGSPSPPPTPKDKPLRIKRGHRKPSVLNNLESTPVPAAGGSTILSINSARGHSPSGSDALSLQQPGGGPSDKGSTSALGTGASTINGVHKTLKKPGTAFELYVDDNRSGGDSGDKDNTDESLGRAWKELPESARDEYQARADVEMEQYEAAKEEYEAAKAAAAEDKGKNRKKSADDDDDMDEDDEGNGGPDVKMESSDNGSGAGNKRTEAEDDEEADEDDDNHGGNDGQEDVEMENYDSDQETQGERLDE